MKTLLLLFVNVILSVSARKQSVRVTGRLMCHGKPAQYAELKLLTYRRLSANGIMAQNVFTDTNGYFDIAGYIDQYFDISGRLWIWHDCFAQPDTQKHPCRNWLEFQIPQDFVNKGVIPRLVWPLGNVDLEVEQKEEYLDRCDK